MQNVVSNMIIDLLELDNNDILVEDHIIFNNKYIHPEIKGLKDIFVKGIISKDDYEDININLNVSGKMLIEDSISLNDIFYEFSCDIDEIYEKDLKKDDKTIDISDILWQNIILEIPLRYTEITDYSKFQGDGWKLISEEESKISNNPFKALIDNKEEE